MCLLTSCSGPSCELINRLERQLSGRRSTHLVSVLCHRETLRRPSKAFTVRACIPLQYSSERGIGQDNMVQELARGISAHGRSKAYKRRGIHFLKKKNNGEFPKHEKKQKTEEAPKKASKFYPAGAFPRYISYPCSAGQLGPCCCKSRSG